MLGKLLEFGRMYENKTFFFCVFEIRIFCLIFIFGNLKENQVFYTGFISYCVS
jgi:hypothetical protein